MIGAGSGNNQDNWHEGTNENMNGNDRLSQIETLIKNLEVKVIGKDWENRERKDDGQKYPGLEDGRCVYGWKGEKKGVKCKYHHPEVCQKQEVMGKMCDDTNCKKHHPRDCITISEFKICSDKHCLKNHLK